MQAMLAQGGRRPTHADLADVAGVNERTIGNVVSEFSAARRLVGGRPARFGPGMGLVLGLSFGAESLRGALVDANGVAHVALEDPPTENQQAQAPEVLLRRLRHMAVRVLTAALDDASLGLVDPDTGDLPLLGIAVAVPSPLDRSKRLVGKALSDGGWRKSPDGSGHVLPLPERIAAEFGDPFSPDRCHALNDVSAAALAVAFDESRDRAGDPDDEQWRVALVVRVGGGLGAATIVHAPHNNRRLSFIDSRLVEGTNGLAGELGHLPIGRRLIEDMNAASDDLAPMLYDKWKCSCGRLHHLEAFASGAALVRRLEASGYVLSANGEGRTGLLRAALSGEVDDLQRSALVDAGRILGRALAGPILMLDPFSITLTGSLATEHLVDGIRRERNAWANTIRDSVEIHHRGGAEQAHLICRGAALAVLRRLVYRDFLDDKGHRVPTTVAFGPEDLKRLAAPGPRDSRGSRMSSAV